MFKENLIDRFNESSSVRAAGRRRCGAPLASEGVFFPFPLCNMGEAEGERGGRWAHDMFCPSHEVAKAQFKEPHFILSERS